MIKTLKKMIQINLQLKKNKKAYFAGDFHLGRPDKKSSSIREKKIISWLNHISKDAQEVFLMGDVFDFWFEYRNVIPKENLRFLSTISNMIDSGINFHYFLGNRDMWVLSYFNELGIKVYDNPQKFLLNNKLILVGHGDGIGKGDLGFKFLKLIFKNKICQFLFRWIHPDIGIPLGRFLSGSKRIMNISENAKRNDKRIIHYCNEYRKEENIDTFIFGHSHYKNKKKLSEGCYYFNCGEWMTDSPFLEFDGKNFELKLS